MFSFWLCLDKFFEEDIPPVEVHVFLFLPNLPTLFFQNLYNQGLSWDGGFLLLAAHPQNETKKSSILGLVSITLVDWSCSDQMGLNNLASQNLNSGCFFAVGKLKSWNSDSQLQSGLLFKHWWTLQQSLRHWLSRKFPLEHAVTA